MSQGIVKVQLLHLKSFFLIDKSQKFYSKKGARRQPEAYREYTRETTRQKTQKSKHPPALN